MSSYNITEYIEDHDNDIILKIYDNENSELDAMIEDTQALRTFFVKRGQMLGQVKVEAIFKDKIILSCDGEEAELR